ncbi:MAG: hypothetical protein HY553_16470 [Elusimicrobia bacterium]|nr:hypothetical protein [Elusimicrobiota bacterium]
MTRTSRTCLAAAALFLAAAGGARAQRVVVPTAVGWSASMTKLFEVIPAEVVAKTMLGADGSPVFDARLPLDRARLWALYSTGRFLPSGVPNVTHPAAGVRLASGHREQADAILRGHVLASAQAVTSGKLDGDNAERAAQDVFFGAGVKDELFASSADRAAVDKAFSVALRASIRRINESMNAIRTGPDFDH